MPIPATGITAGFALLSILAWSPSPNPKSQKQALPLVLISLGDDCRPGTFPSKCTAKDDYNEAITQFDLVSTIDLTDRVARIHYSVLGPGGVISQHSHRNRPCFEYILQGVATETKQEGSGKVVVRRVAKGEVEQEATDITHWWKNETKEMVRMIAVDIFEDEHPSFWRAMGAPRTKPFAPPNTSGVKIEEMGSIDLAGQFPAIEAAKDYVMRSRRITLRPGDTTPLYSAKKHPAYFYIVRGNVLETRSDQETTIRRPEEFAIEDGDVSYFWQNPTSEPAVLWVVEFAPRSASP